MGTMHESLIDFRNALGYRENKDGFCVGYAEMAINAFLVGRMDQFDARCQYIHERMQDPSFLPFAKEVNRFDPQRSPHI